MKSSIGEADSLIKILFIHEVDYIEKVQFEIHEFPEYLSSVGHEVYFYDFQENKKSCKITRKPKTETFSRICGNSLINLIHARSFGSGIFRRLSTFLFSYRDLKRVCLENDIDLLVLYSVPTFGIQSILLMKKLKIPLVFRALDVSHKIRPSKLGFIIKKVEWFVFQNSIHISTHNPRMIRYINSLLRSNKHVSIEFPPLDLELFSRKVDPEDLFHLKEKLGLGRTDKVIVYVGTLFHFVGLTNILHELATVPTENRPRLLIVGGGDQLIKLETLAEELRLNDYVIFTGYVDFQLIPNLLRISDVAINPLEPSLVTHCALPNKVLQYLASGIEVVSTELDGLKESFENLQHLHWVRDGETVLGVALNVLRVHQSHHKNNSDSLDEVFMNHFQDGKSYFEFEKMLRDLLT